MKIVIFISTVIFQILLYSFLDKRKTSHGRKIVLISFLLLYFLLLPYLFFQLEFSNQHITCGLPVLGMYMAFWIFGGGLTIATHVVYSAEKKAWDKRNENLKK